MRVSRPANCIVPAKRSVLPIGVTATRASGSTALIAGSTGGWGKVML